MRNSGWSISSWVQNSGQRKGSVATWWPKFLPSGVKMSAHSAPPAALCFNIVNVNNIISIININNWRNQNECTWCWCCRLCSKERATIQNTKQIGITKKHNCKIRSITENDSQSSSLRNISKFERTFWLWIKVPEAGSSTAVLVISFGVGKLSNFLSNTWATNNWY